MKAQKNSLKKPMRSMRYFLIVGFVLFFISTIGISLLTTAPRSAYAETGSSCALTYERQPNRASSNLVLVALSEEADPDAGFNDLRRRAPTSPTGLTGLVACGDSIPSNPYIAIANWPVIRGGSTGTTAGAVSDLFVFIEREDNVFRFGSMTTGQIIEVTRTTEGLAIDGDVIDDPLNLQSRIQNNNVRPGNQNSFDEIADEQRPISCEEQSGIWNFGICGALSVITNILNGVDSLLATMLATPNDYIENEAVEQAWSVFRNMAYLLIVPAMLLMVVGTALGFDFVSNYTVKKALPRMVAAIIFIALSLEVTKLLIIITNTLGNGVQGLLATAAGTEGAFTLQELFAPSPAGHLGVLGLTAVSAVAITPWLLNGGWAIILGFLGAAAFAILAVLFLLAFRQVAIMILAIIAPLAILAWIFPGNTKLWGLWRTTFLKLLLLYPVIMLAIGGGKLFASVLANMNAEVQLDAFSDSGFMRVLANRVLILIAYVGPYFVIPRLFKAAGGAFANLAGMVNDSERGPMDRMKNWGKKRQESDKGYVAKQTRKQTPADSRIRQGKKRGLEQLLNSGDEAIEGDGAISSMRSDYRERRRGKLDNATVLGMEEQLKKEEDAAATFGLHKEIEGWQQTMPRSDKKIRDDDGNVIEVQKGWMTMLKERALDESENISNADRKAAIRMVTQQQGVKELHEIKEEGTRLLANGRGAVAEAWNAVTPESYPTWKAASVDLAGGIDPPSPKAAAEADPSRRGEEVIKELREKSLEQFSIAGDAELAKMKAAGWERWLSTDESKGGLGNIDLEIKDNRGQVVERVKAKDFATRRLQDTLNNEQVRSTVPQETIDYAQRELGISIPKPTISNQPPQTLTGGGPPPPPVSGGGPPPPPVSGGGPPPPPPPTTQPSQPTPRRIIQPDDNDWTNNPPRPQ